MVEADNKALINLTNELLGLKLNKIEIGALLALALVDKPMSKTACKDTVKYILSSTPLYKDEKKTLMDRAVDTLEKEQILVRPIYDCEIDTFTKEQIAEVLYKDKAIVKSVLSFFSRGYYYYRSELQMTQLALVVSDFKALDKIHYLSTGYYDKDFPYVIGAALNSMGDVGLIKPFLKEFDDNARELFLKALPYTISYHCYHQLEDIYLDSKSQIEEEAMEIYVSVAQLMLFPDEARSLTDKFNLNQNYYFFLTFLEGDTEKALEQAEAFLLAVQTEYQHKRKELPGIFGLLYALVLLSTNEIKNLSGAATLIRSTIKNLYYCKEADHPYKNFADTCILFINHKLGKKSITAKNILDVYRVFEARSITNELNVQFLSTVLHWLGRPNEDISIQSSYSEKVEFELRAAGIAMSGETRKVQEEKLEQFRAKYKTLPLAEIFKAKEVWEDVLSILSSKLNSGSKKASSNVPSKRLIWLIDPLNTDSLKCLEQSRNKSGWSKGKERSLTRMVSVIPDLASNEDKAIIGCLRKHNYYNDFEIKDNNKLLRALAQHPEVYTLSKPHLPLSIRIVNAQIQIDKKKNGASIKLNPSSPYQRVTKETPTSYIFTEWSAQALQVYNVLHDCKVKEVSIPENGMGKAKPVIERLTESMPITGNFAKSNGKKVESDNIPVFQLTPVDDQLHVQLLIEVINNEEARYVPGFGSKEVQVTGSDGKQYVVKRDHAAEKEVLFNLAERITWLQEMKSSSSQLFIDEDEEILDFLADVKEHAPEVKLIWPKGERLRVAKAISHSDIRMSIKQSEDWFAIDGSVQIDEETKLSIQQLLNDSKGGTLKYIQLDDKTYLSICSDLQKRLVTLDAVAHTKGKKLLIHPLGSNSIEKFTEDSQNLRTDKAWKQHLKNLDALKAYQPTLVDNLQAELRPYQQEGVYWLDRLHHWGVGACLADDMGLGKTVQAISMLLKYAGNGPSLVLAPSSVCNNWVKELVRFAPTLSPKEFKNQKREEVLKELKKYDVLIVSYGLIQSNPDLLDQREWNMIILDEAHAIKNAKSVRSKAVMKLKAQFKLITTGTPIQNHLGELWNLFQFINPGMLGSHEQFSRKYIQNDNASEAQQKRRQLNKYISPFILRRHKNEVLDDLPEKTEITLRVPLSDKERALYEVMREEAIDQISGIDKQGGSKHMQILAEITKLRQLSCNAQLVVPDSDIPSSKLEALERLVDDLRDANHKALIFSQFTKHLALIRTMLDQKGITYQYLDGSTTQKNRQLAIDNFQQGKSDLFLISLKAGGVGLNLTAADYVIHMDPWWNPAVEDQASDRAHRIGQQRPVTIYRIIAENTIEEKIVKLHHEKRDLADKLLANTDQSAQISSDELFELINESYE